jgi:hypothetical protein
MPGRACARLTGSSRFMDPRMRLPRINYDKGHLVTTWLTKVYGCTGLRNGSADRLSQPQRCGEGTVVELLHITQSRSKKPLFKDALK